MKKMWCFGVACLATMAALCFMSCGDDDDEEVTKPVVEVEPGNDSGSDSGTDSGSDSGTETLAGVKAEDLVGTWSTADSKYGKIYFHFEVGEYNYGWVSTQKDPKATESYYGGRFDEFRYTIENNKLKLLQNVEWLETAELAISLSNDVLILSGSKDYVLTRNPNVDFIGLWHYTDKEGKKRNLLFSAEEGEYYISVGGVGQSTGVDGDFGSIGTGSGGTIPYTYIFKDGKVTFSQKLFAETDSTTFSYTIGNDYMILTDGKVNVVLKRWWE